MEWLILFITSWLIFFFLVRWKEIRRNIWGGVAAIVLQLLVDTQAMNHHFYKVNKYLLPVKIFGSSILFVFGSVLVVGILLAQYHPRQNWLMVINIFVLGVLYSIQEYLLVLRHAVIYLNWNYINSIIINIFAMIILSWFSIVVLGEREKT